MNKKFKIGTTLIMISGVIGIIIGIVAFVNLHFAYMKGVVLTVGIYEALFGLFTVLLGYFSRVGKNWALGLTGAIAGFLVFFPTGIAAIILVSLGHKLNQAPAVS